MARPPRGQPRRDDDETTPSRFPETTPPDYYGRDHSFTLQAIMELQRSVGEIGAKVDRLAADVKSQGEKLDTLRTLAAWISGGVALIVAVLMFLSPDWRGGLLTRLLGGPASGPPAVSAPPGTPRP